MIERRKNPDISDIERLARGEEMKKIMTAAIDEWLEKKWAQFGKWTAYGFAAALLGAALLWILAANGWHKP